MGQLDGKTALVTGATSGIGRRIALAFASEGANVVACGRDQAALASLATAIGDACLACTCDVTDEAQVEAAVAAGVDRYGGIDVAFNSAGWGGTPSTIAGANLAIASDVFRVNVIGIMASMKYESRAMKQRGGGSIVNVSSVSATQPARGLSAYCSSKAAVDMLSRTAALELAEDGIRVNVLAPGTTETPMTAWIKMPGVEQMVTSQIPLGRLGHVDDMVGAAVFLASDASRYVTGQILAVDGGLSMPAFPDMRSLFQR